MSNPPATIRFRNPGGAYPGPSSRPFGGATHAIIGGGHQIAIFPTMVDGASSMMHLLHRVYAGLTFSAAIAKWSGGNNINSYLRVIEAKTRWTRHDYVTKQLLETPDMAIELCKAMAWHEAGREYPMTDAQWLEAHEQFMTVIGGGSVPIDRVAPLPVTAPLELAKTHLGERRIPGAGTNPFIEGLFIEVGSPLRGDDHSYCAVGAGAMLKRTGFAYIEGEAGQLARNYLKYGHALDEPEEGCLVIFWRVKPNSWQGHVAFVESWTATTLTIVGFNQSGAVTRMTVPRTGPRSQVLGYRRPVSAVRTATEAAKDKEVQQTTVGLLSLLVTAYYVAKDWLYSVVDAVVTLAGFLPDAASTAVTAVNSGQQLTEAAGAPWPSKVGLIIAIVIVSAILIRLYRKARMNDGTLTVPPYETDIEPEADAVDMFDAAQETLPAHATRRREASGGTGGVGRHGRRREAAAKKPAARKRKPKTKPRRKVA